MSTQYPSTAELEQELERQIEQLGREAGLTATQAHALRDLDTRLNKTMPDWLEWVLMMSLVSYAA